MDVFSAVYRRVVKSAADLVYSRTIIRFVVLLSAANGNMHLQSHALTWLAEFECLLTPREAAHLSQLQFYNSFGGAFSNNGSDYENEARNRFVQPVCRKNKATPEKAPKAIGRSEVQRRTLMAFLKSFGVVSTKRVRKRKEHVERVEKVMDVLVSCGALANTQGDHYTTLPAAPDHLASCYNHAVLALRVDEVKKQASHRHHVRILRRLQAWRRAMGAAPVYETPSAVSGAPEAVGEGDGEDKAEVGDAEVGVGGEVEDSGEEKGEGGEGAEGSDERAGGGGGDAGDADVGDGEAAGEQEQRIIKETGPGWVKFTNNDYSYDTRLGYIDIVRQDGVSAGHIELIHLRQILQCNVVIFSPDLVQPLTRISQPGAIRDLEVVYSTTRNGRGHWRPLAFDIRGDGNCLFYTAATVQHEKLRSCARKDNLPVCDQGVNAAHRAGCEECRALLKLENDAAAELRAKVCDAMLARLPTLTDFLPASVHSLNNM
jgi:hypothetical protein